MTKFFFVVNLIIWGVKVRAATSCYDTSGNPYPNALVCDPTAAFSVCCVATDFCMTNGLCFNNGVNNLLANQGCSDQNWGEPCKKYCPGENFQRNLFPCPATANVSTGHISYCCGKADGSNCCDGGNIFEIPVGGIMNRPGQVFQSPLSTHTEPSTASTKWSSTPTGSATSIQTGTTSISSGLSSSAPANAASPTPTLSTTAQATQQPNSYKSMAIGLGVGIPVGLIIVCVLLALVWELRRYNNNTWRRIEALENLQPQSKSSTEMSLPIAVRMVGGGEQMSGLKPLTEGPQEMSTERAISELGHNSRSMN
ncbi:hypothetical protein BGZ60DRAFT_561310 [Tricladium varicosporioides]|nr:hypothetical protein BGZ60DRAFT_561310 [Hymenoscyphus varicosporioides]